MIGTNIVVNEKILEIGGKRSAVPVHKQNYHMHVLENIFEQGKNIYITPKVDGVLTNFEYCGLLFECEKIDNNMFLIDVLNGIKYQSLYTKFKMLESIFKIQMLHKIKSKEDVQNIVNQYADEFIKKDQTTLSIKPIFIINKNYINDENDNLYDMLSYVIYNKDFYYNTDGWIIYTDDMQTIKWKPSIHMTIDVEYNIESLNFMSSDKIKLNNVIFDDNVEILNGVYRCYYYLNEKIWKAKEKREDKIRGNKYGTIVTIESHYYVCPTKKIPIMENIQPYYFDNINNNKYNKKTESHNIRNVCLADVINEIGSDSLSILDIGCGNGSLYYNMLKNKRDVFYTGIDIDPYILTKVPLGGCYLWQNINDLNTKMILEMSSNRNYNNVPYDVVTFIHSLHFCDDIPKLFDNMKKLTDTIIIVGIFEDYFKENFELSDVKVKKQPDGKYDFYYKWKDHKIRDKLLKNSDFSLDGWKCVYEKQYKHDTNPFINMHKLLVLKKL